MNITIHDVQLADSADAWLPKTQCSPSMGRLNIREGVDNGAEATLFFWSADHCQQLADELNKLAQMMRDYELKPSTEDSGNDNQSE